MEVRFNFLVKQTCPTYKKRVNSSRKDDLTLHHIGKIMISVYVRDFNGFINQDIYDDIINNVDLNTVKNPKGYFGIKYRRIKKRRGHKKAIVAIARMMMICIYHMILTGEEFRPSDYEELMNPKPKKFKELSVSDTIAFLKESGIDIETIRTAYENADPPPCESACAISA